VQRTYRKLKKILPPDVYLYCNPERELQAVARLEDARKAGNKAT